MRHAAPTSPALTTRALLATVALVCAQLLAPPAQAQDDAQDRAEAYYQQAIQQLGQGQYREALASFDEAIKLVPDPVFYCNRSAALLKLGEGQEALSSLEICMERLEIEDPQERATLHSEVQALRLSINVLEPTSQRIARQIATRPDPRVIPAPTPAPAQQTSGLEIAAWTTGGLGAACFVGAVVLELLTQPLIQEYKNVARDGQDQTRFDNLKLALEQRRLLMGTLVLTGAASAITSGVLFWLDQDEAPSVSLGPTTGGAILQLQGAF